MEKNKAQEGNGRAQMYKPLSLQCQVQNNSTYCLFYINPASNQNPHQKQTKQKQLKRAKKLPEKLVNALLTERPFQKGELHLARVNGRHGGVAKPSDPQRVLQLRLRASLRPQPPGKADWFQGKGPFDSVRS